MNTDKLMLRNRINRFFDEGAPVWSKDIVRKHGLDLNAVNKWLREWADKGYIEFVGDDDVYFKVLDYIPDEE